MLLFFKNVIFTLLVPGTVAVLGPLSIARGTEAGSSWFVITGLLMLIFGLAIYCWCVWDFAAFGQATPAPIDAPKRLVVRGLYRYIRNPMYVGVLSVILGWTLLYANVLMLVYCLAVAICFQLFVVFYEEPILQQSFGAEYAGYKASVNRWLPKLL